MTLTGRHVGELIGYYNHENNLYSQVNCTAYIVLHSHQYG
jgi:hypothetical protein